MRVSIHAPWEGCDSAVATLIVVFFEFQFTHPGKGATGVERCKQFFFRVSIHAPWEGCDKEVAKVVDARHLFQFTHPGKGATSPS